MECGAGYGIFLWNEGGMLLIFPNLFLVRDMLVQERGAYEGALQVLTKCNLLKVRSSEAEGAKLVC